MINNKHPTVGGTKHILICFAIFQQSNNHNNNSFEANKKKKMCHGFTWSSTLVNKASVWMRKQHRFFLFIHFVAARDGHLLAFFLSVTPKKKHNPAIASCSLGRVRQCRPQTSICCHWCGFCFCGFKGRQEEGKTCDSIER